jgi:hypothetical protein
MAEVKNVCGIIPPLKHRGLIKHRGNSIFYIYTKIFWALVMLDVNIHREICSCSSNVSLVRFAVLTVMSVQLVSSF